MIDAPHPRYEELVVGHALSALEPGDEQELLRHLPTCEACERDLAVHRQTLGHLAHVVDQSEPPPPQLWDAIRTQVVAESGSGAFPSPGQLETGPPAAAVADLSAARSRRGRRRRTTAWASMAAAVAVVATVSVVGVTRARDDQGPSTRLAAAVAQVLESAPGQTVPLAGKGGKAVAVAVISGGKVSLIVDGLEPNDAASSTYVLWAQSGAEKARAMGTFDVDGAVDVEHDMADVASGQGMPALFVITRESGRTAPDVAAGAAVATGRTV